MIQCLPEDGSVNFNNQWLLQDLASEPEPSPPSLLSRTRGILRELAQVTIIAILLYVGLNVFIPRYEVEGHSMEPNFHTAERVVVSRLHYVWGAPHRGDIIVFQHTEDKNLIKRIIGLPGEVITMTDGQVFVDGRPLNEPYVESLCEAFSCRDERWELGEDEYFVLGDNRNNSWDSQNFGPIKHDQIIGKVLMRYWPPESLHLFWGSSD